MNILITGATGFIGRHLAKELSKNTNYKLFLLVRNPAKVGANSYLPLHEKHNLAIVKGDITDRTSLEKNVPPDIDIIFHCAGYVGNANKALLHSINVEGTENICRFALARKVKRVVYTSSVAVVSGNYVVPLVEDLPYKANNPYGESKIQAEKKALEYRAKGLNIAIIRPCLVYGEDEPHLLKLLAILLKYRLLPLLNGGKSLFHLGYIGNVVDALIFAMTNDSMLQGTFFISDKEVLTTKEAMSIIAKSVGGKEPFTIPESIVSLFIRIPFFGKTLENFLKDREYSTQRIRAAGFIHRYCDEKYLAISAKTVINSK